MSNYAKCPKCLRPLCNASVPNYCMYCGFEFKKLKKVKTFEIEKLLYINNNDKNAFYEFQINKKCKLEEFENNYYRLIQNENSYFFYSCDIEKENTILEIKTSDNIKIKLNLKK